MEETLSTLSSLYTELCACEGTTPSSDDPIRQMMDYPDKGLRKQFLTRVFKALEHELDLIEQRLYKTMRADNAKMLSSVGGVNGLAQILLNNLPLE